MDAFFSGQEASQSIAIGLSVGANHTTEDWKIRFSGAGDYVEDRFELSENENFLSVARSVRANALIVRSLADHWSLGLRSSGNTSTFSNIDRRLRFAPAVEYSLFPYEESSERNLRFVYSAGVNVLRYEDETVFGVSEETLYDQNLNLILDFVQPWGSAQVALEASAFLNELSENRLDLSGGADWRVFRGLSLVLFASFARIADQRSLPAGGVTERGDPPATS